MLRTTVIYLCLFVLALAVKFTYLQERSALPDFAHPTLDSKYHDDWARAIATGEWGERIAEQRGQAFFRAPLYPYFAAAVYKISGTDYYRLRLVQALIGALSVLVLLRLTWLLFGVRAGWIGAVLYLAYWPVTYFESELLIPVLIIFLDLLAVALLVEAARRGRLTLWLLAGLVLGLSAIARPNIVLVVPFLLFWVWKRLSATPQLRGRAVLVVALGCAAAIAPVTLRNAVVGKDFVPIASQGGVNFYIGNNPESNGVRAVVPGTRADWWGGFDDANDIAEGAMGRKLRPSEASNYWFKQGLRYLTREPADAVRLYARKIALFFGNGEVSNNRQLYFVKERSLVLSILAVNFAWLLAFAVIGILRRSQGGAEGATTRLDRSLPLYFAIPYAISVILFFVTSRYRLPVSVFLVPYAAYGILWVFERFKQNAAKTAAPYLAIALVVFVASVVNPFGVGAVSQARGYYSLGVDHSNTDYDQALEAFDASIDLDPSFAPAWKMRGWVKYRLGKHVEATDDLLQACRLDSSFADAFFTLGVVYQVRDLHDRAGPVYERVLALEPDRKEALTNLADVHLRRGNTEAALPLLRRALEIDDVYPNAVFGLGSYYEQTGQPEAAVEQYRSIAHLPAGRLGLIRLLVKAGRIEDARTRLAAWRIIYPDAPDIDTLARFVARYAGP